MTNRKTLMDMATIFGRYGATNGRLDDMEVSDEINACSVRDWEWMWMASRRGC